MKLLAALAATALLAAPAAAQDVPGSIYDIPGVDDADRADRTRDRAVEDAAKRSPGYYGHRHMRRPDASQRTKRTNTAKLSRADCRATRTCPR